MSLTADFTVARDAFRLAIELEVAVGERVAVLGPNGAGKTTFLRALCGLTPIDHGKIALGGAVLDDPGARIFVEPEARSIGVVFQDLLLFPHLDARDNVAFGLTCRGVARREARRRALAWIERVGLSSRARARPGELSGGEAQRVALARALVIEPALLLLDEPLAAVDASFRAELRRDLRRTLAEHGGVHVLVTHDPFEAMALADRLIVLEAGRVVQSGPPGEIAERPRSAWVADFVGVNLLRGQGRGEHIELAGGGSLTVAEPAAGGVLIVVHPRSVALYRARPEGSPRNVWRAVVRRLDREGTRVRVLTQAEPGRVELVAELTPQAVAELALVEGSEVWVAVKATDVRTYPA